MPIISFWNNKNVETGKTLSLVAIATYMAIMHNYKILIVDTEFNKDTIRDCFWEADREGFINEINSKRTDISTGIEGLAKAVMSNKSSPEIITNYTKIVFRDRLEILLGVKGDDYEAYNRIVGVYKDILLFAKKTYDMVFVNMPNGLDDNSKEILSISDLIILNSKQNMKFVEELVKVRNENPQLFPEGKTLINLGEYDQYSKYNTKNLARFFGERKELLAVPYCTQFFEACNEGKTADYFIKYNKIMDISDSNAIFIMEVKRTVERIIYRLQEMQLRM